MTEPSEIIKMIDDYTRLKIAIEKITITATQIHETLNALNFVGVEYTDVSDICDKSIDVKQRMVMKANYLYCEITKAIMEGKV